MKAWIYRRYGGPEVLEQAEIDKPEPKGGEVRLEVVAFAMNPLDGKLRSGQLRFMTRAGLPRGTGYDVAGIVDAAGAGADLAVGEVVVGILDPYGSKWGAAADYTCLPAKDAVRLPIDVDPVAAASVPAAGITALQTLRGAGLRAGQRALIVGASGGVGSFAVPLAKLEGAHVTAVASAAGQEHLASLGADRALDRTREDWMKLGERFDLVFDCTGSTRFAQCRHLLAERGAYANVVPTAAMYGAAIVARILTRRRVIPVMRRPSRGDLERLVGLLAEGKLRPPITRIASMGNVPEIQRELEAGNGRGKIVVRLGGSAVR
jgi:NADPH:quinone reductase-like Zn-dependent oxidoreductase